MKKNKIKIAFLDRDGTLIFEPYDAKKIDSVNKLQILPGVIEGLKRFKSEGYELIMVSNQDGVGTRKFPLAKFKKPQRKFLQMLKKEGIEFYKIFICPHAEKQRCGCRKPKTGLINKFLRTAEIDFEKSFMVGDRETDIRFAKNIGVRGFKVITNSKFPRISSCERITNETDIFAQINIDGAGSYQISTGINFFNHMLAQFAKHSLMDVYIRAADKLKIDEHHIVEDVGIALGTAIKQALGEKTGIKRYGFLLPMDEALVETAIDIGGRPCLVFTGQFRRNKIGDFPTELTQDFFKSITDSLGASIHMNIRYGRNDHHKIEALFKAFAKAIKGACEIDPRGEDILLTTKGII